MADKDLYFSGKIESIRQATPEEIDYKYVYSHGTSSSLIHKAKFSKRIIILINGNPLVFYQLFIYLFYQNCIIQI
ncbi:MAG: hypothetical protein R2771_08055 [Saprospiraceae bacterium]